MFPSAGNERTGGFCAAPHEEELAGRSVPWVVYANGTCLRKRHREARCLTGALLLGRAANRGELNQARQPSLQGLLRSDFPEASKPGDRALR